MRRQHIQGAVSGRASERWDRAKRTATHGELDALVDELARMTLMAETAMGRATTALLQADAELADRVIADVAAITALRGRADERALVLATERPPAADELRLFVAAAHMTADLEQMGVLARHVAEVARRHAPNRAVPEDAYRTVEQMGLTAEGIAMVGRRATATRDWRAVADLEDAEHEMHRLLSSLYEHMPHRPEPYGTGVVADTALVGRCYERYAGHAVSVARRAADLSRFATTAHEMVVRR